MGEWAWCRGKGNAEGWGGGAAERPAWAGRWWLEAEVLRLLPKAAEAENAAAAAAGGCLRGHWEATGQGGD